MQAFVPTYLEHSIKMLTDNQQKFRDQMSSAFGQNAFGVMEEMGQKNMEMFREAFAMFTPFVPRTTPTESKSEENAPTNTQNDSDLDRLRNELAEMQKRLDRLSR